MNLAYPITSPLSCAQVAFVFVHHSELIMCCLMMSEGACTDLGHLIMLNPE